MAAPFSESFPLMRLSNSSAGGQLEHPSDVNNSTTTAFLCAFPGAGLKTNAPSKKTDPSNKAPCHHERELFMFCPFLRLLQNKSIYHCGNPAASTRRPLQRSGISPETKAAEVERRAHVLSRCPRWEQPRQPVPHCESLRGPPLPSAGDSLRQSATRGRGTRGRFRE